MLLERAEDFLGRPGRLSRRTFLGRAVQICAAVGGLAAGIMPLDQVLAACGGYQTGTDPCGGYANMECCCLSYTTAPHYPCNSDFYNRQCPPTASGCGSSLSAQPYEWTCRVGTCTWICGECYCSCCSYAYSACSPGCPCSPAAPSLEFKLLQMQHARRAATG